MSFHSATQTMFSLRAVTLLPFQSKLWCLWKFFNYAPKTFGRGNIGLLNYFLITSLWLKTDLDGLDVGTSGQRPILGDYIQRLYDNTDLWYLLILCSFLWHSKHAGCLPFLHGQSSATEMRCAHIWTTLPSDSKKSEKVRNVQTKMHKYIIWTQDFKIISLFSIWNPDVVHLFIGTEGRNIPPTRKSWDSWAVQPGEEKDLGTP